MSADGSVTAGFATTQRTHDPVGHVLKWALLGVAIITFAAYARSQQFYDTTLFWQWMRMPGDIVFAAGALLMAWDFLLKLRLLAARTVGDRGPASKRDALMDVS